MSIDTNKNVTIISGPSDHGKSAIVRALKWACFNRPRGSGFVTHGQDKCRVGVEIDGVKIVRKKTKKVNGYLIDGRSLKAIGVSVPPEVEQFLNVSELNFQSQHDSPLWLTLGPRQAGKELNKIVNLDQIDIGLDFIQKEVRQGKVEVDLLEDSIVEAEETVADLQWVKEAEKDFRKLKETAARIKDTAARLEQTRSICLSLKKSRSALSKAVERKQKAVRLFEKMEAIRERQQGREKLTVILDGLKELQADLRIKQEGLKKFEDQVNSVEKCPTCNRPLFG